MSLGKIRGYKETRDEEVEDCIQRKRLSKERTEGR